MGERSIEHASFCIERRYLTEHGAFFDGLVSPTGREQGRGSLLDALARALQEHES